MVTYILQSVGFSQMEEQILQIGANKAKVTANTVLDRVRKKLGY